MRLGEHPARRSIVSSSHRSWSPRSDAMKAWTSSIITKRRDPNIHFTASGPSHTTPWSDSGVIWRIPSGESLILSFAPRSMSPCHPVTLIPESRSILSSLENWSSMRALVGPMYNAPMPSGGSSESDDITGSIAASVFPEEVPADMRRWSSESNSTAKESSWTGRHDVHPSAWILSRRNAGMREK